MPQGILERLADGVVLGDGGYLLELERRGYVRAGPFTPEVSITHPGALEELHREFLLAGAEVLQALTFYASEDKLATVGLGGKVDDINREAVRIAKSVAAEGDSLVAMTLSMTWVYDPGDRASEDRIRKQFDRQLEVAVESGVDLIIAETFTWLDEAVIATQSSKATGLPVITTVAFEQEPHDHKGNSPADCARRLADAGADVVGINCLRNPANTLPYMQEMRAAVSTPLACQPVAYETLPDTPFFTGRPEFPFRLDPLQLTRHAMGRYALEARDMGINYIGSCCGSVAAHVRAMARSLGKLPDDEAEWRMQEDKPMSAYEAHGHTDGS
ncbi:MAG: homocysteine S-methyltransferase family protein [Actinobacteria bacterium]|nr:homocysteine S-methyltransferase family protein [Actinomycetota bacterium]MDQ3533085.1 homocysteine S-methyltransferase family protein [Actinomycetota bacterium]